MSDLENSDWTRPPDEAASPSEPNITPRGAETQAASPAPHEGARETAGMLALVPVRAEAVWPDAEPPGRARTFLWSALAVGAAMALAGALATTGALVIEHRHRDSLLAENAHVTESLAQSVKALAVRIDAIESPKVHEDLVELRRSVGEMKSSFASARDLNGAVTQLSQRMEKLDREESAKVDKLGERMDHDAGTRAAELSARIDKLEKRAVAPITAAAPAPAPPSLIQAKQPAPAFKPGSNISMETTGSIQRPRPVLQGYIVLGAQDDVALVGGRYGEREVRLGDFLPGAGRVERIQRQGHSWVILTSQGLITAAEPPLN